MGHFARDCLQRQNQIQTRVTGSREWVWERPLDRGKFGTGRYVVLFMRLDRAVLMCHELMSSIYASDAELCTCS